MILLEVHYLDIDTCLTVCHALADWLVGKATDLGTTLVAFLLG